LVKRKIDLKNQLICTSLYKEVNCTEPLPSVRLPCLDLTDFFELTAVKIGKKSVPKNHLKVWRKILEALATAKI
jgi:hypothetical protein